LVRRAAHYARNHPSPASQVTKSSMFDPRPLPPVQESIFDEEQPGPSTAPQRFPDAVDLQPAASADPDEAVLEEDEVPFNMY